MHAFETSPSIFEAIREDYDVPRRVRLVGRIERVECGVPYKFENAPVTR